MLGSALNTTFRTRVPAWERGRGAWDLDRLEALARHPVRDRGLDRDQDRGIRREPPESYRKAESHSSLWECAGWRPVALAVSWMAWGEALDSPEQGLAFRVRWG
jgi:hypothetical protein